MLFDTEKKDTIIHEFPENIDYYQVLKECNEIIDKYNPNFRDPFKKNLKIYNQAKLIKVLIKKL